MVYTIGHSTNTTEAFDGHLMHTHIDVIVDVRSVPYSRYASQFNRETIAAHLAHKNIRYIYMGNQLGARHSENRLLSGEGIVDFSKVERSDFFTHAIERLYEGIRKGYTIALMCAEKNPLECHRFSLIARHLHQSGCSVSHIVDTDIYPHRFLERKLRHYFLEHGAVSTNLQRVLAASHIQKSLFEADDTKEAANIYVRLNKMVGYQTHPSHTHPV